MFRTRVSCSLPSYMRESVSQRPIIDLNISRLANAELYMAVPAVITRFDLEVFQSSAWDTEMAVDAEHHSPRLGSMGVQVFARSSTY